MTDTHNTTPAPETSSSDWEAKSAAHDRLHASLRPRNNAALFGALAAAGVTHVIVSFDGYGDSGQIQDIEVKASDAITAMPEVQIEIARAEWGQMEPVYSPVSLADAIEGLVYDLLDETHCGWENNEGAYGNFTFDVAARTVTLAYNERYVESEYSEHVF